MEFRVVPAGRGSTWFRTAVRMLDRNPRGLLAVTLLFVVLEEVPSLLMGIPDLSLATSIALLLFGPALLAGMLHAIAEAEAGRPVSPWQLFEGLRRPGVRAQLIVLGVCTLSAVLLVMLSMQRLLLPEDVNVLLKVANQKLAPDSAQAQAIVVPVFKVMLIAAVILFVLLAGLFFAVPRVMFDGRPALPAFFESIRACAANVLSMTVYGLMWLLVSFAIVFTLSCISLVLSPLGSLGQDLLLVLMFLVWIVLLLANAAGYLVAWRDVFGRADGEAPQAQAGILV